MKKILVKYYSKTNLGDDLFVQTLAEQFSDCKVQVMVNPMHRLKHRAKNLKIHPYSYVLYPARQFLKVIKRSRSLANKVEKTLKRHYLKLIEKSDAFVNIGGSIFTQSGPKEKEIDFQTAERPEFAFESHLQGHGKSVVIGANLGPIFTADYQSHVKNIFSNYAHVCLRDYASYQQIRELSHVQYAPDVLFLAPQPEMTAQEENVVISVIDITHYSGDQAVIDAYYTLLRDSILAFDAKGIPVTLVSFCKSQGDEDAIRKLKELLPDDVKVSSHCYNGDIRATLSVLSNASYIIASRFHSMILGVSFGKPVFPISYNCKTKNYLNDLDFRGRSATFATLTQTTCEDILYNYENKIVTDCELHKKYAENQFRGLRMVLEKD